jgi:branched-chain amino acid transport system ATP-binding protein
MPISAMPDALLKIAGLTVSYGKLRVLNDVTCRLQAGETLAILGANGAGKTTLLNTLSGFLKPVSGAIYFNGERIDGQPPHGLVKLGLVQVSQDRDLFTNLRVIDNLTMGAAVRGGANIEANLQRVFDLFPRLAERRRQIAGTMSGGEQQMLAIARAIMTEPVVLLLDEPSSGLAPIIIHEIERLLTRLKETRLSMVLVEQNVALASKLLDRFLILRDGMAVAEGQKYDLAAKFEDYVATHYV